MLLLFDKCHASSPRLDVTVSRHLQLHPPAPNPKNIHKVLYLYHLYVSMNVIEHEFQRCQTISMQPPCGDSR